jgi:hypothetical protein
MNQHSPPMPSRFALVLGIEIELGLRWRGSRSETSTTRDLPIFFTDG